MSDNGNQTGIIGNGELPQALNETEDTPLEGRWQQELFNPDLGIGVGTEGEYYFGLGNEQKYDFYSDVSLHRQAEARFDFHYQPVGNKSEESENNRLTLEFEGLYDGRESDTNYTLFGFTSGGNLPIDTQYSAPFRFARANAEKPVDTDGDGINETVVAGQIGVSTLRWVGLPVPETIQGDIYFATSFEITPDEWEEIDQVTENIREVFNNVNETVNRVVDQTQEAYSSFQDWAGEISSSASERTESALDRIQQAYSDLTSIMG